MLFPAACFREVLVMTSGFDNRPGSTDNPYPYARVGSAGLMPPPVKPESGVSGSANKKPESSKGRRGLIVLCCVLVLVLVCALGAGFWFYRKQQAENAAWQAAHQYQSVLVEVNGEGYDAGKSSFVPLRVTGEDLDKKKVDKRVKFFPGKTNLKLLAGRYRLLLEASPILDDGRIFVVPKDPVSLQVAVPANKATSNRQAGSATKADKSGQNGKTTGDSGKSSTLSTVFKLDPISPESVSDEQIAQLKKIYKEYGMDNAQIEQCVKTVTTAREAKKAEIAKAKAEAEKAKKAEEAKKQAEQAKKAQAAKGYSDSQLTRAARALELKYVGGEEGLKGSGEVLKVTIYQQQGDQVAIRLDWYKPSEDTQNHTYYTVDRKTGVGYVGDRAFPFQKLEGAPPIDLRPYL